MDNEIRTLLVNALPTLDAQSREKAKTFLRDQQAKADPPVQATVAQLLPTLRTRKQNAARSGKTVAGLAETVDAIEAMPLTESVISYGLSTASMAGLLYIRAWGRTGIGVVLADI
jgi:hypothetical protein